MRGLYNVFLILYAGVRDGDVGFGVVWIKRRDIWERVETFASRPQAQKTTNTDSPQSHLPDLGATKAI